LFFVYHLSYQTTSLSFTMASSLENRPAPPSLKDMTIDNITANVIAINSTGSNARLKYLMERAVTHMHNFAREVRLSTDEWMIGLNFLVGCGQISDDLRHVSAGLHID
jgi:hypothetical protein